MTEFDSEFNSASSSSTTVPPATPETRSPSEAIAPPNVRTPEAPAEAPAVDTPPHPDHPAESAASDLLASVANTPEDTAPPALSPTPMPPMPTPIAPLQLGSQPDIQIAEQPTAAIAQDETEPPDGFPNFGPASREAIAQLRPGVPRLRFVCEDAGATVVMQVPPAPGTGDAPGLSWTDLWQQLMHELHAGDRPWQPEAAGRWVAPGRTLAARQLGAIAEALHEAQVRLTAIVTDCPDTAIAAIQAGYQVDYTPAVAATSTSSATLDTPEPLYLDRSVRSGVEIRYPGAVVVRGDINPGGAVVADGDILVWGRLRGVAHAGASGNTDACIMALQLEATQVRVADRLARVPAAEGTPLPEVAYIGDQGIRISSATDFAKTRLQSRLGDLPAI